MYTHCGQDRRWKRLGGGLLPRPSQDPSQLLPKAPASGPLPFQGSVFLSKPEGLGKVPFSRHPLWLQKSTLEKAQFLYLSLSPLSHSNLHVYEPVYKIQTHREQTCVHQRGREWDEGGDGVSRYKLGHGERIIHEVLLSSAGNSIQSPGLDHDEKEY